MIECADCWSPAERKVKKAFEEFKAVVFYPVVFVLKKIGVPVDLISYVSMVVGVISAYYVWFDLKIAGGLLLLSLVLDGIDGALARAMKRDGVRGAVMDCFADQVVISATMIGMMAMGIVDLVIGGVYLVMYPLLIVFSILRNIIKRPRVYVFRPRTYVYVAFWVYAFFGMNYVGYVTGVAAVAVGVQVVMDFYFLRERLK